MGMLSAAIACIKLADGTFGTGFCLEIKSKRYLFTNNHVIPDVDVARGAEICFDYTRDRGYEPPNVQLDFAFFWTDIDLDCTVIRLTGDTHTIDALKFDPRIKIEESEFDGDDNVIMKGSQVEVMGHPGGRPLQKTANGYVLFIDGVERLMYNTATLPGNSGSPILKYGTDIVIGLHHTKHPSFNEGTVMLIIFNIIQVSLQTADQKYLSSFTFSLTFPPSSDCLSLSFFLSFFLSSSLSLSLPLFISSPLSSLSNSTPQSFSIL